MVKLSELIKCSTDELSSAVVEMKNLHKMRDITDCLVRVHTLENNADDLYSKAIAKLFDNEQNAIELIKNKEILTTLEQTTDRCEDLANIMELMILKISWYICILVADTPLKLFCAQHFDIKSG